MPDKKQMKSQPIKKRSRTQMLRSRNRTHKNLSSLTVASSVITTNELNITNNTIDINPSTRMNMEGITFVCLNLPFQSIANLYSLIQEISDFIQVFTDSSVCFDWIQSSTDFVFFITTSNNTELIAKVHAFSTVEAIFILNSEAQMNKTDFQKLSGIFNQHEELIVALRDTLNWFERGRLEVFAFEYDKIFLWSQLWKEKLTNTKLTSSTGSLTHMVRNYYQSNPKMLIMIDTFRQLYRSNDVLRWCLHTPFPARPLNHALRTRNHEQLNFYAFLLNDVRCVIKHRKHKSAIHVYKGLKLSSGLLDSFAEHAGKLICTSGFFVCTTSRTTAWSLALSPSQRPDLCPVLFSIICDRWAPFTKTSNDRKSDQILFDIYTTFRVIHVSRGKVSIVKMKTADKQGKQLAKEYWKKSDNKNIDTLLQDGPTISRPSITPVIASSVISSTPPSVKLPSISVIESDEEIQAQKYLARDRIDLALAVYQRIKPVSPRILNIIGRIYAEKKNDNENALKYHLQALKMQEKNGEDVSETLTDLGIIHHNRHKFDLALSCHMRALKLRETTLPKNDLSIASSLRGMANAHWARREFPEALDAARQVLLIHQTLKPINESNVATSWGTLANIYHESGDSARALDLGTRAVVLLEGCEPANSSKLAAAYHNLAAFQLNNGALLEARYSFERAFKIYSEILPPGHPKRVTTSNYIQRIIRLQRETAEKYLKDSHE